MVQRDERRQIRMLLQHSCQKIQLGLRKLTIYLSRHRRIQKNKLPATLNNVPMRCIIAFCNVGQARHVIMVPCNPCGIATKGFETVTQNAIGFF